MLLNYCPISHSFLSDQNADFSFTTSYNDDDNNPRWYTNKEYSKWVGSLWCLSFIQKHTTFNSYFPTQHNTTVYTLCPTPNTTTNTLSLSVPTQHPVYTLCLSTLHHQHSLSLSVPTPPIMPYYTLHACPPSLFVWMRESSFPIVSWCGILSLQGFKTRDHTLDPPPPPFTMHNGEED